MQHPHGHTNTYVEENASKHYTDGSDKFTLFGQFIDYAASSDRFGPVVPKSDHVMGHLPCKFCSRNCFSFTLY